ncbi:hypothetical protein [Bacillus anthracis]|uniref:JAB domain-containing protein n=1 Tax=Bacillus anthracis TaxID=1392 RepID=A0A2B0WRD3_BACAN|nr:hypothetical protein [Bacillus anthracis]PFL56263.1 hypothetical protein COJ30_25390 [Bacillus anthracis]
MVTFNEETYQSFIDDVLENRQKKCFGFFLAKSDSPEYIHSYVFMKKDKRGEYDFENIDNYYKTHQTAGFLADFQELIELEKYIRSNNLIKVGVFHSHMRHPAIFDLIDLKLHPTDELWHLIIAIKNIERPIIRIFTTNKNEITEKEFMVLRGE